jgi:two-component system sensor histidine kinase SenX3
VTRLLAGERERPPAEPVDVGDAAAAAGERWLGPARRSGHELAIDEGDPGEVCSSVEDVAVMLDNLIENALHYSPAGTRVTIDWRSEGRLVRIAVADEGPGIDESEREQVFERFYRGSASHGGASGTGLGLNVVEALAKRWDGEAKLVNRPEGGARAEIILPAHSSLPAPDPQLDEALPGRGWVGDR